MKIFFVRHGQTQANIDNVYYTLDDSIHPLTKRGEKQATHTGKYLDKIEKFDLIISSPRLRCIQTAKLISKEIGYKDDIIINKLITEVSKITSGKSGKEVLEIMNKNKQFSELYKQLIKTNDPFELINVEEKLENKARKLEGVNDVDTFIKNLKKFLNQLKKLNKKSILVVAHGGIIEWIQRIITNTEFTNLNIFSRNNDKYKPLQYEDGNTKIMACLLKDGKFKLVIPSNTLHLANFK